MESAGDIAISIPTSTTENSAQKSHPRIWGKHRSPKISPQIARISKEKTRKDLGGRVLRGSAAQIYRPE
jgi:hypothetical protein